MAKQPPPDLRPFIVSVNKSPTRYEVDAVDCNDAINRVIANHNLKRDPRNFSAVLKKANTSAPAVEMPKLPG